MRWRVCVCCVTALIFSRACISWQLQSRGWPVGRCCWVQLLVLQGCCNCIALALCINLDLWRLLPACALLR